MSRHGRVGFELGRGGLALVWWVPGWLLLGSVLCVESGCQSGRTQPLRCDDPEQTLRARFPTGEVPTSQGPYTLFADGKESGCVVVRWEGQTDDIPVFVAEYTQDQPVKVQDANGNIIDSPLSTTLPAGIQRFLVSFFVTRQRATEESCARYAADETSSCFTTHVKDCIVATELRGVDVQGGDGICRLCSMETCNGLDDDCDGQVDDGVCDGCRFDPTASPASSGCPQISSEVPLCIINATGERYDCVGDAATPMQLRWRAIGDIQRACQFASDQGKKINAGDGTRVFLCDQCPGQGFVFREINAVSRCAVTLP